MKPAFMLGASRSPQKACSLLSGH